MQGSLQLFNKISDKTHRIRSIRNVFIELFKKKIIYEKLALTIKKMNKIRHTENYTDAGADVRLKNSTIIAHVNYSRFTSKLSSKCMLVLYYISSTFEENPLRRGNACFELRDHNANNSVHGVKTLR